MGTRDAIKPKARTTGTEPEATADPRERAIRPVKRSYRIAGHLTSLSLEAVFWDALKDAARMRGLPQARLIAEIDARRGPTNLSSAVRVWLYQDLQRRLSEAKRG